MAPRTDLEHVVLGIIQLEGPCTPYAVRQTFAKSPSSHWSGSAGAIYPVVERLEASGLLASSAARTGRRASRLYELTPAGRRTLKAWLRPPLPEPAALMDIDPLRVRVRFLSVLTAKQRTAFLAEAEAGLQEQIVRVTARCAEDKTHGDLFAYLISRGALRTLRARVLWLREVRATLDEA